MSEALIAAIVAAAATTTTTLYEQNKNRQASKDAAKAQSKEQQTLAKIQADEAAKNQADQSDPNKNPVLAKELGDQFTGLQANNLGGLTPNALAGDVTAQTGSTNPNFEQMALKFAQSLQGGGNP